MIVMKIAICDDCEHSAKLVYDTIANHHDIDKSQIDIYMSGTDVIDKFKNGFKYDIVFLDVEMPMINGIETGKIIKEISPKTYIVFATSYPQYAIEAYECEAYHYLLKPLTIDKTLDVINRILQKIKEVNKHISIKIKGETIYISIQDIYYVECCNKHVIYHLKNKDYDCVGNISDAYVTLKDYGFLQIHQGYIVNMNKISHIDKLSIVLIDGRTVAISVRKRTSVLKEYAHYMEEHI